jgi:DNA modification methylase
MFSKHVKSVKDYKFYFDRLEEKGNVWHFGPESSGDKGYAPFPDELARRCILPSSNPGDIVLDPFSGSGTTVKVAEDLGRRGIGVELYA